MTNRRMKRLLKKNPIYLEDLYEKDNFTFGTCKSKVTTKLKGFSRPTLLYCEGIYDEYNGDYDCNYPFSGEITCDQCLVNYGLYDPRTGKRIRGLTLLKRHAIVLYEAIRKRVRK